MNVDLSKLVGIIMIGIGIWLLFGSTVLAMYLIVVGLIQVGGELI